MKQHITVEQLNELEEEKIWELFDLVGLCTNVVLSEGDITIGKMIEILDRKTEDWIIGPYSNEEYIVDIKFDSSEKRYINAELCDALWKAVKEVL